MGEFVPRRRVAVRSPHGAGKTALASWIVLWGVLTSDDVKVVTTASAWRQLSKFLWPEIGKWARRIRWDRLGRAPIAKGKELLDLSIKMGPTQEAFAVASDNADLIEGAHAEKLIYIFDEAKAVGEDTWDAAEGAFATGDCYAFAISTPGNRSGRFYEIHRKAAGYENWWTRHIRLDETISAGRVSAEWAEERRLQWGEESPVYQAKVLGEFPEQSENALFSLNWIEAARERELPLDEQAPTLQAADIARFGDDDSCDLVGRGDVVLEGEIWHGNDLMQSAGRIKAKAHPAKVDVIGMGGGVVDRLREQGFDVTPVDFGGAPADKEHYRDVRDESYYTLSERFRDGRIDLSRLPKPIYDRLCGELTAMGYDYTSDGKIAVWPKKKIKELTGHSPDVADTLAILYSGVIHRPGETEAVKMEKQASRWNTSERGGSRWRNH